MLRLFRIKEKLYTLAARSKLRKWALSLTGWKYWTWQIVVCGFALFVCELILNRIGFTLIPW